MAKIRKFPSDFAKVPNALLQDSSLSFKARGIWAYMQSLPDDWDFAVERIATDKDGKDSVRSGIYELEAAGYLIRNVQSIGKGGAVAEYVLLLPMAKNPTTQNVAMAENPPAGNPPSDIGITKKQIPDKEVAAGRRERKKAKTYDSIPEIPLPSPIHDSIMSILSSLYSLGWRWPVTKTYESFRDQLRASMKRSRIIYESAAESGFSLDDGRLAHEMAKFTAYFESKPCKDPFLSCLNWLSRSK